MQALPFVITALPPERVWAAVGKQPVSSSAPWWATPLVAGIFTLVGVALAQSISIRLERNRRKHEQARRLDASVREAVSEYLSGLLRCGMLIERAVDGKPYERWPYQQVNDLMLELALHGRANRFVLPEEIARLTAVADRAALVLMAEANSKVQAPDVILERFTKTLDALYEELVNMARVYFGLGPLDAGPDTGEDYRRIARTIEK